MVSSRSRSAPRPSRTDWCHPRDAGTGDWHGVDESLPRLSQTGKICRLPRNRPRGERRVLQKVWFRRPARRSTHRHIDLVYVAAARRASSRRLTENQSVPPRSAAPVNALPRLSPCDLPCQGITTAIQSRARRQLIVESKLLDCERAASKI